MAQSLSFIIIFEKGKTVSGCYSIVTACGTFDSRQFACSGKRRWNCRACTVVQGICASAVYVSMASYIIDNHGKKRCNMHLIVGNLGCCTT